MEFFSKAAADIYNSFVAEQRWSFYLKGTGHTLIMAILATIIGIFIGMLIAMVKVQHVQTGKLRALNRIATIYTTVIRGTPVLLQLLIFYTIVFKAAPLDAAIPVAALAFGVNSGAYVSEIFRAGILSIDKGQMEAGRSLGLSQGKTMRLIILPQAIKNILPALFNEFISLLKETSVAGYIAIVDITRAGDIVRSRTWTMSPLFIAAAIYLILVLGLTQVQQRLERRLSTGDSR